MALYAYYLIPIIIFIAVAFTYLRGTVTAFEAGVQVVSTAIVLAIVMSLGHYGQVSDTMLVNGVVTEKTIDRRNCPTGWQEETDAFCTSYTTREVFDDWEWQGTGKNRKRVRDYDTEYLYDYPWEQNFRIVTNAGGGQTFDIPRVDAQGVTEPPRFASVEIGDPATAEVTYNNYIKGAASTLFDQSVAPANVAYPAVYDLFNVNPLIVTDYHMSEGMLQDWNTSLAALNSSLADTGANVIVVVTGNDALMPERLARAWDAHNVNDVVVTIGARGREIIGVDVRSWSKTDTVNTGISADILDIGSLDPHRINGVIGDNVAAHFELQPMENFEYLADRIPAPTWVYVMSWIILALVTPALTVMFHRTDYFGGNRRHA